MKVLFLILFYDSFIFLFSQDFYISETDREVLEHQEQSTLDKKKINTLLITKSSSYMLTLVGLNYLWYSDYPRSAFHFNNDNGAWLQMDKLGHAATSYHMGVLGIKAYQWTGMKNKKAIWYGGMSGSLFLTTIEVLDGFSKQWGASTGDLLANSFGSMLAISQSLLWNEQRIQIKYSFYPSVWAKENPNLLGENYIQNSLKDYNGQNYWIAFNLKSCLAIEKESFPDWISLAFGYGANGMINAYHQEKDPNRERQYLLSFDLDLNRIKTTSRILNSVLHAFSFLKFPMPTLEIRNGNFFIHPIYY